MGYAGRGSCCWELVMKGLTIVIHRLWTRQLNFFLFHLTRAVCIENKLNIPCINGLSVPSSMCQILEMCLSRKVMGLQFLRDLLVPTLRYMWILHYAKCLASLIQTLNYNCWNLDNAHLELKYYSGLVNEFKQYLNWVTWAEMRNRRLL